MDEIQAAVLIDKLRDFNKLQNKRKQIAKFYLRNIKNNKVLLPKVDKSFEHGWHLFVIRCKSRNRLRSYLKKRNIETMIHYPIPPHKQKAFQELNKKNFRITEKITKEILSLPIFPTLKKSQYRYIANTLNNFK